MTISSSLNKHVYAGNNLTRNWNYSYPIIDETDIEVYITDSNNVTTLISTNYTVDTVNSYVVYPTIISGLPLLQSNETITLRRNLPLTQEIDLVTQGPLPADTLESGYDKLTMITQQISEEISRCIKFPVNENPTPAETEQYLQDVANYTSQAAASAASASASASAASASAAAAAISESNSEQAYQDALTAIQDFVDHFIDKNEVPAGLVNGINKDFTLSLMPVNDVLKVFINGLKIPENKYTFTAPTLTLESAPATGQQVEVSYITNGMSANPVVPSASYVPEYRTINALELANKKLTLINTPLVPSQVVVDMIEGTSQAYGLDFNVINGNELNWNGLNLDGQILLGTTLRIAYFY